MADGYWNRQQQPMMHPSGGVLKRPRMDYDLSISGQPSGHEMHSYFAHDDDRGGNRVVKDTKTIGSAYDRYLQSAQNPSFASGEPNTLGGLGRGFAGGMQNIPTTDHAVMARHGAVIPDFARNDRSASFEDQLPMEAVARQGQALAPLPPDASSTLYVEGLPSDSTRREVSHIFRPFVGYKEVRIVSKESRHRGGDPIILCFVDFANPACAATAMSALQGYKVDEHNPESSFLKLQFSRFPGPRSGAAAQRGNNARP
ncbi:RNA-binding protein 2 [Humulus lupulus]|uniref:RNA-binding protein 2 n=1 Tax=Humulus lupulus TaxID=3486 RepID=UPI002B414DE1|nr:RNA-binding protein 2 [Humulus lupulus]